MCSQVDAMKIIFKCVTIKGSNMGTRRDTDEAINFIARRLVDVRVF